MSTSDPEINSGLPSRSLHRIPGPKSMPQRSPGPRCRYRSAAWDFSKNANFLRSTARLFPSLTEGLRVFGGLNRMSRCRILPIFDQKGELVVGYWEAPPKISRELTVQYLQQGLTDRLKGALRDNIHLVSPGMPMGWKSRRAL